MGRNTGSRPARPEQGGNNLLVGVLIGTIVGVSLAAAVAWYLMKSPSPLIPKSEIPGNPPLDATKAAQITQPPAAASGVGGKPRFEFYKVLTDKPGATVVAPPKPTEKPRTVATYEPHILQVGSFSTMEDAEKLKARLALLGVEAGVQTATIPDKGVRYRVRLGPYKSADELNNAHSFLKQNGVDSTPMRMH